MADFVTEFASSPFMAIIIGAVVLVIVAYKLGFKINKNAKMISRAEVIRKQMIAILSKNKGKYAVLKQRGNIIGITKNYGFYTVNGKKVYSILYMPRMINVIPKFWAKNILIVSEDYLTIENEALLLTKKNIVPIMKLKDDYFIDQYFNLSMNFTDDGSVAMVRLIEKRDQDEVRSSVQLAQTLRLSNVDFNKPFSSEETPASIERRYQEVQKA